MRKTLSMILSVIMILSVCSFAIPSSAAPEGTAINTADDFMNMAAEGKYYLNADITLAATYPNAFVGTFDGNGKTVTVSNPMFADFSGEVKNLTINGAIVYADQDAAAFAVKSSTGFNATNVTSNVNITVTGNAKYVAGIVGTIENNENPVTFTNCVNNGDLYLESTADEKMRLGGMAGIIDGAILYNCKNTGDIYVDGYIAIAGGMVGRVALHKGTYPGEAYNCVNTGNITVKENYNNQGAYGVGNADAGGIFGHVGCSGQMAWYKVWGCMNSGKIDAPYRVGGMVGYCYASGANAYIDVQFCINQGSIIFGRTNDNSGASKLYDYASPFVAYTNSPFTTIKYNIDTTSITKREGTVSLNPGLSFIGCSSANASEYDAHDNYVFNMEQYTWFSWASDDKNAAQRIPMADQPSVKPTTLEEIKSGKVAYEMNTAAADDAFDYAQGYEFYQVLGTDDFPTSGEKAGGWVILENNKYKNGEKAAAEATTPEATTEAPKADDTTAPVADDTTAAPEAVDTTAAPETPDTTAPEAEKTGCGAAISGAVAIVAILGTALIIKKRD